jgi:tetratricopeptide (TPR) repeat protein
MHALHHFGVILVIATLAGCAALPSFPEPAPIVPPPEPTHAPPVPQGTAPELFKKGLAALQQGDGLSARPLLQQVLVLEPNHRQAGGLLSQIDADPVQMLGKEKFPYKVQPGDTFSLIAKRFLGDPFKFFILAKYNNFAAPDHLEAGTTIYVPGKKPPPAKLAVPEQPAAPEASSLRLSEAKSLYTNGRFADAINVLEQIHSERGANAEVDDLLITAYSAYAKKLAEANQPGEATKVLSRGLSSYPSNEHLKKQLEAMEGHRTAEQAYQEANRWLNEGDLEKAYSAYGKTLRLVPDHTGAKAAMAKIKPKLVEDYYTHAVRARRRQNYADALSSLDKVIEMDPGHELARANREEIKAILSREQSGKRK